MRITPPLAAALCSLLLVPAAWAQNLDGDPLASQASSARAGGGRRLSPLAANVILPKAYATRWGELANAFPFGTRQMRYQQVYLGAEAPTPNGFTAVAFREDERFRASGGTIRCVIKLGYTTFDHKTIGLGSKFDANFNGGNKVTVFSGSLNLPRLSGTNKNLASFAIRFPFKSPWVWAPQKGRNILLEVVNSSSTNTGFYDKCQRNTLLTTTTRIWNTSPLATAAARGLRNEGLVTEFIGIGGCAPATFTAFGTGCKGSAGVPVHSATGTPRLGGSYSLDVSRAKANARGVMLLGLSKSKWLGIALPFDLTALGAAGCKVLAAGTLQIDFTASAAGHAAVGIRLANNPYWCGMKIYTQYVVLDNANRLGVVLSNAGESKIGS